MIGRNAVGMDGRPFDGAQGGRRGSARWVLALAAVLAIGVGGCFSLGGRAAPSAPDLPPQPSPALEESAREAAAVSWIAQLQRVQSTADEYVARLAGVLVALHGAPAHLPTTEPELAASAEAAESRVRAFAAERDEDTLARLEEAGAPASGAGSGDSRMIVILYGLGALLVAGGVALGWFLKSPIRGVLVGASGLGIIAVTRTLEVYPWVGGAVLGLVALAGLIWLLATWLDRRARARAEAEAARQAQAATEVVRGAQALKGAGLVDRDKANAVLKATQSPETVEVVKAIKHG